MSVYDVFAAQIQKYEGFSNGSRSFRNNNPGNIRPGSLNLGQVGVDSGGFGIFASYGDGYNALIRDIQAKFSGRTRTGLGPDSTAVDFFAVYNPVSDGGVPAAYAQQVVNGLNAQYGSNLTIYNTLGDIAALDSGIDVTSGYAVDDSGIVIDPGAAGIDDSQKKTMTAASA